MYILNKQYIELKNNKNTIPDSDSNKCFENTHTHINTSISMYVFL